MRTKPYLCLHNDKVICAWPRRGKGGLGGQLCSVVPPQAKLLQSVFSFALHCVPRVSEGELPILKLTRRAWAGEGRAKQTEQ